MIVIMKAKAPKRSAAQYEICRRRREPSPWEAQEHMQAALSNKSTPGKPSITAVIARKIAAARLERTAGCMGFSFMR